MSKTDDLQKIISNIRVSNVEAPDIGSVSNTVTRQIGNITSQAKESISFFSYNSLIKYGLILFILALLGFNLFTYLGKITDTATEIIKPLTEFIGATSGNIVKQAALVSGEGTKGIVDVASGTIVSGVDVLQQNVNNNPANTGLVRNNIDNKMENDEIYYKNTNNFIPIPDDAGSSTQMSQNKAGHCYIGEDRGFRSCIEVSENDTCMSGQIFPTRAICINPSLRK